MNAFRPFALFATLLSTSVLLLAAGCSALSTGAAMRVEVEVYKGPLSKEPVAQLGELCGVLDELAKSLEEYRSSVRNAVLSIPNGPFQTLGELTAQSAACSSREDDAGMHRTASRAPMAACWCDGAKGKRSRDDQVACQVLAQLHDNVEDLRQEVEPFRPEGSFTPKGSARQTFCLDAGASATATSGRNVMTSDGLVNVDDTTNQSVAAISELGMQLKLKSMYRAEADAGLRPQNRLVRMMSTGFVNMTAEYGNQLGARADAWLKQARAKADFLPQSVYLRDSQPTESVNLYVWNRAAAPALLQDVVLHPIDSLSSEDATNRVRGIERLFADAYWSNINTVYASGQGEVSMALVKDDIGNWNLKSFSSDPTELLQAYKQGGLALIKTAADLARDASGVPNASRVLAFGNSLALGTRLQAQEGEAAALIEKLHAHAASRLEKLGQSEAEGASPARRIEDARRLLSDYERLIDLLSESAGSVSTSQKLTQPANRPPASARSILPVSLER